MKQEQQNAGTVSTNSKSNIISPLFNTPTTTTVTTIATTTSIVKPTSSNTTASKLICYRCGKVGHMSWKYPTKPKVTVRQVEVKEEVISEDIHDNSEPTILDYSEFDNINIRKVKVDTSLLKTQESTSNGALSLRRAQQAAIPAPITVNDHRYIALVDCGASDSLISSSIVKDIGATIIP